MSNTMNWDGDETRVYRGRVKWFSSPKGYGFITVIYDDHEYDVFVHHTSIKTQDNNKYKFLYKGEYVEFSLSKCEDHPYQAVSVRGIDGGPLMCEARPMRRGRRQKKPVREIVYYKNGRTTRVYDYRKR